MTSYTDTAPTYSSLNYVTQSSSLETAIGDLDNALSSVAAASNVQRIDYSYDRSLLSETDRAQTPILVTHNLGKKPVINVIDSSPETSDYWGMYSSPTYEVQIDYPDNNSFRIWTDAAIIEVIAFF